MGNQWDIEKIQQVLPQRYPFLFIDRVMDIDSENSKITCLKNVSINDYFFEGHFPGNPVMPGALILEAMAQASILLYAAVKPKNIDKSPVFLLGSTEVKFMKPVHAGDQLIIDVQKQKITERAGIVSACTKVGDAVVAKAQISFGVQFGS